MKNLRAASKNVQPMADVSKKISHLGENKI